MKDLLIRLCENADGVSSVLRSMDLTLLRRGRLVLNDRQLAKLLPILLPQELRLSDVGITQDGMIAVSAAWSGMTFRYRFRIEHLRIGNGNADGAIAYHEERSGAGVGSAILGLTGKSGIAVALAGTKWARTDDSRIYIRSQGLPQQCMVQYEGISRGGLVFLIS